MKWVRWSIGTILAVAVLLLAGGEEPVSRIQAVPVQTFDVCDSSDTGTQTIVERSVPILNVCEPAEHLPSYLDDAVFIGDSVSLKLKYYVMGRRKHDADFFGKARFLAAGSMGSGNALKPLAPDSIHPSYDGKKALLEDSAAGMEAGKIYIMLGINDIAPYGVRGAAENLEKLTLRIQDKLPDARIFIQSATPMLAEKQKKTLNNANLEQYNQRLIFMCQKWGWSFLNIASVLQDEDGTLRAEYCSDPDDLGLHFTDEACDVWIHYILTHTGGE